MFDNPIVLYGLIFAAALLLVDTLLRMLTSFRKAKSQVSNRIETLRHTKGAENAYGELLKRRGMSGRDGEQTIGGWINKMIVQTGKEISQVRRWLFHRVVPFGLCGWPDFCHNNLSLHGPFRGVFRRRGVDPDHQIPA